MKHRDLTIFDLPSGDRLLVACDAAGGIGPKERDAIRTSGYVLGRFTARVALMEVVAGGGRPIALVNNCCVEPSPTGDEILRGILDEALLAGLPPEAVTGSFEKNVPTVQTALGVTALAISERPLGRARPGDLIIAVGRPKVGAEVALEDPDIADLPLVRALACDSRIHDLLPVGSRGIAREAEEMARSSGLQLQVLPPEAGWDWSKSAGPSTACLAAVSPGDLPALARGISQPWAQVGRPSQK